MPGTWSHHAAAAAKRVLLAAAGALLVATRALGAEGPAIDFSSLATPGGVGIFNAAKHDTTSVGGIAVAGFTVSSGTWRTDRGYLWLRNDPDDHGLGYCSKDESCGPTASTGSGDWNELSNQNRKEIIRLTLPDGYFWSDLWVSSLDSGGSNANESGTLYWSDSATIALTGGATFSHTALGANEGSIFHLLPEGFRTDAKYLFFRAGTYDALGHATNGSNNDYLVWGVAVTPVPEPGTYAMLLAGLGLVGLLARRRRRG